MGSQSQVSTQSRSKSKPTKLELDDISNIDLTLMTLRKPTPLKKVIESIPMPTRAVPKNGLPLWYRLGLQCKLPVPKTPTGRIIFSRGRLGEDIIGVGLGADCPRPSFDLTDPYCNDISYEYDSMHDRHMSHHYSQQQTRRRMRELGFCTNDYRAICTLKQFNEYRKYLYIRFMDRIHMEMIRTDERARDDITLKSVQNEIARQSLAFRRAERVREMQEKHERVHTEELAEKRRLAQEQEKKAESRMKYLQEYNERERKKRIEKVNDHKMKLKHRIQAAAEMELRRKIKMIRQWRVNERRRIARLKLEAESKKARLEKEAENKWNARVEAQNYKIQEEQILLKLYEDDMAAASRRRAKRAMQYAYKTDLALQGIKLANFKQLRGEKSKKRAVIKRMGDEFGRSKRGAMTLEQARSLAREAMAVAESSKADPYVNLSIARNLMDQGSKLPGPPLKIIDMLMENAIMQFARRRVHVMLKNAERDIRDRAENIFFKNFRPSISDSKRSQESRWLADQLTAALSRIDTAASGDRQRGQSIVFGEVFTIEPDGYAENELKSARDRTPTPVPSLTKLVEVTFTDKPEDLPSATGYNLSERKKLIEMVNSSAKMLSRTVFPRVERGMDTVLGMVTLPNVKHPMEWGEAVEAMCNVVIGNRINVESSDVRQTTLYLTQRILRSLQHQMKLEKKLRKQLQAGVITPEELQQHYQKDFYDPKGKRGDFYVPSQGAPPTSGTAPSAPQKK